MIRIMKLLEIQLQKVSFNNLIHLNYLSLNIFIYFIYSCGICISILLRMQNILWTAWKYSTRSGIIGQLTVCQTLWPSFGLPIWTGDTVYPSRNPWIRIWYYFWTSWPDRFRLTKYSWYDFRTHLQRTHFQYFPKYLLNLKLIDLLRD